MDTLNAPLSVAPLVVGPAPYLRVQYAATGTAAGLDEPSTEPPSGYTPAGPWQIVLFDAEGDTVWARVLEALPWQRLNLDYHRDVASGLIPRIFALACDAGVPAARDGGLERLSQTDLRQLCRRARIRLGRNGRTVEAMRAALRAWAERDEYHEGDEDSCLDGVAP